jgi:non-homologous end joining protein Ku
MCTRCGYPQRLVWDRVAPSSELCRLPLSFLLSLPPPSRSVAPVWKGLDLVRAREHPVRLHPAVQSGNGEIHFQQLYHTDLAPLRYDRMCTADGKEVKPEPSVPPDKTKVLDLVERLRESLEQGKRSAHGKVESTRQSNSKQATHSKRTRKSA